jgi:pyridoxal phosphate enzyme (YggS family)
MVNFSGRMIEKVWKDIIHKSHRGRQVGYIKISEMSQIAENIEFIRRRIAAAAERNGRSAKEVKLVAVSKTYPPELICEGIAAGQRIFGENRVQDALPKIDALPPDLEWHLIGHLQTNKVRKVIGRFSLFHGVDNTTLALQMNRVAGEFGVTANILLEVNISGEDSKFGFTPSAVPAALEEILPLPYLRVEGLMTMAPFSGNPDCAKPVFAGLRKLRDALSASSGNPLKELSMGMSGDFEQGIAEGATIVRIGSAIFGSRAMQGN